MKVGLALLEWHAWARAPVYIIYILAYSCMSTYALQYELVGIGRVDFTTQRIFHFRGEERKKSENKNLQLWWFQMMNSRHH